MADQFTTHYNLTLPENLGDTGIWGPLLNGDFSTIDSVLWTASQGTTTGVNAPISSATSITLTNPVNNIQNISFSASGQALILPAMNATGSLVLGGTIQINNVGPNSFSILANDGTTVIYSSAIGTATLSAAGSGYVGPVATGSISSAGSGYVGPISTGSVLAAGTGYTTGTYTNVPLTGGSGSGAAATIVVDGSGTASTVTLTSLGSSYKVGDSLSASATIIGSGGSGFSYGIISLGSVSYSSVPFTGGSGSGATANITVTNGAVASVTIVSGGQGFLGSNTLSAANTNLGGSGSGFAYGINSLGTVKYTNVPLTGGSGSGATGNFTITNGVVASFALVNPGTGFASGNSLSASNTNLGGSGSGVSISITSLQGLASGQTLTLTLITNITANGTFNLSGPYQPSGSALGGDLIGVSPNPTIASIQGTTVSGTTGSINVVFSASPAFTGTPTAPTAAIGTNTTQLATMASLLALSGRLRNIQIFSSTGTYTPTSGTQFIIIEMVAGGGGGGGVIGGTAGSGASGAYILALLTSVQFGASQAVVIGALGAGGLAGVAGANGGNTTFGSLLSCTGGVGGANTGGASSSGGTFTVSSGTLIKGVLGQASQGVYSNSIISGISGSTPMGQGGFGGANNGVNQSGFPGTGYGSGGGGANSAGSAPGSNAAPGYMIIYEY